MLTSSRINNRFANRGDPRRSTVQDLHNWPDTLMVGARILAAFFGHIDCTSPTTIPLIELEWSANLEGELIEGFDMFRVLVTDASYKNAIALASHIKRALPDVQVLGHDPSPRLARFARWYCCFDAVLTGMPLETALEMKRFDMVIPVGATSVLTTIKRCPDLAVLPARERVEICYDKYSSVQLARSVGVPTPETCLVRQLDETNKIPVSFPCVVKPSREAARLKRVDYCKNELELNSAVANQLCRLQGDAHVLVQEFVNGKGCGFFALMDHGLPLRVFMHQRIREYPPSGGRSTAARALYSERLKALGLKLLSALQWHGVAMVEFKFSESIKDFQLIEINGKFWGSLELALSAGVNFGADLVRLFRGEKLAYSEEYDRAVEFYWPLDDDLLTLLKTRSLRRIADYWKANAHTNLFQSMRADTAKSLRLAKKIIAGSLAGQNSHRAENPIDPSMLRHSECLPPSGFGG
jgi:hypothetical protein